MVSDEDRAILEGWRKDWNQFIRDRLRANLDPDQQAIVQSVQENRRTSVRSGHARGKDFTAACISLTFLYLYPPSKVINTAPTDRQAIAIMMSEISSIHKKARGLGGDVQARGIKMLDPDWYMMAFKASDASTESWSGFHSPNILVVVTEASGIEQNTFDSIEGCLTGTLSRLLIVFNPNQCTGEAYQSTRSPLYQKFTLSCLNAPNVVAKEILIPGQVDYEWVKEKLDKPGWVTRIDEKDADPATFFDFQFDGVWYRPGDLFLVKVMGEFPREGEDQLIPLSWIEQAQARWPNTERNGPLTLGGDIAGMGTDKTCLCPRYGDKVEAFKVFAKQDHMETAGKIKQEISDGGTAILDTIGEGAGVHSRLIEQKVNSVSGKFSEGADGKRDLTGEREFTNMRAWCYWSVRDALDPKLGGKLALPQDDELTQELTAQKLKVRSDGKIGLVSKDDIKKQLGRSPDKSDSLALTFWPAASAPRIRAL